MKLSKETGERAKRGYDNSQEALDTKSAITISTENVKIGDYQSRRRGQLHAELLSRQTTAAKQRERGSAPTASAASDWEGIVRPEACVAFG